MIIKPLYNHVSEETAYVVNDYPYSFTLRCTMKFWIESHPKKGFRLVRQSQNPKNDRWNKPHKSTYSLLAGNLYLDEENHVHWAGLTEYSDVGAVKSFIESFPEADLSRVKDWIPQKILYLKGLISGRIGWIVNGTHHSMKESEKERYQDELAGWESLK